MNFISKFLNHLYFKKNAPSAFEKTYEDINNSKAYLNYCLKLHGTPFACLNTLSQNQLLKLKEIMKHQAPSLFLDLGAGNGELTKFLVKEYNSCAHGIDFSYTPQSEKSVSFFKEDIETFKRNTKYDLIISVDSFYMIRNYRKFLQNLMSHLNDNKQCALFFTLVNNSFSSSPVKKTLDKLKLKYELIDYTEDDLEFWKHSKELLEQMNDEFVDENNFKLWNIKKKETDKNILLHQNQQTNRYLLIINKIS